jgi:hypothetical protein
MESLTGNAFVWWTDRGEEKGEANTHLSSAYFRLSICTNDRRRDGTLGIWVRRCCFSTLCDKPGPNIARGRTTAGNFPFLTDLTIYLGCLLVHVLLNFQLNLP